LKTKVEINEIQTMNSRMDEMPTRKEVKQVRTDLFGNIEKFSRSNEEFKLEFRNQSEMIARYDEILCSKSSV